MNILEKIVNLKKERLRQAKLKTPIEKLKDLLLDASQARDFRQAVKREVEAPIKLIAEIKKASPSKGIIRADFDPAAIAAIYETHHVSAISVLTEEDFFQGDLSYIKIVKKVSGKPVLRKDFIFDDYQILEARAAGADAILLIAAILDKTQLTELYNSALKLGMAVLLEIHNEDDLEKALYVDADIIGINNRDLKTLSIDLSTTLKLKKQIPAGKIIVSESGINTRQDVEFLQEQGIDAMLIGTALMKSDDISSKIKELMNQ